MIGFTKCLSREAGTFGVKVNAIAAGIFDTESGAGSARTSAADARYLGLSRALGQARRTCGVCGVYGERSQ